jgi:tetratricopeptide (TPR) repeat protein
MRARIVPSVCAVAIALSSARALASPGASSRKRGAPPPAPAPAAPAVTPEEETPLQRAEQLFRRGVTRYETARYDEAVQLWTEAYEILEPTRENRAIRNDLVYNISSAQVEAYRIDRDPKRLRQAKQLLERYVAVYRELSEGDDTSEQEIGQAETRIAEIDAMLDDAERRARIEREQRGTGPATAAAKRQARALVISGAAVTSFGVVGLAVAFAGVGMGVQADRRFEDEPGQRELNRRRGRQANVLIATGTALGVAFLAAGITLLVIGKRNERKLRANAVAWGGTYGLGLSGRF